MTSGKFAGVCILAFIEAADKFLKQNASPAASVQRWTNFTNEEKHYRTKGMQQPKKLEWDAVRLTLALV